ncbi:hypothetical protein Har1130_05175 [Haloarcula sp. CBA1130]|uniref:hypothetical protein n=1 Tax=unclassified Haloarcula TaxID=2624677 RepID=UPI0012439F87|nr:MULTISPECIES: hypothetical protein [unclassified Haloarcula]KAA9398153.1 hypothetical protein Har1129_07965 [Haloarcula sp. CBA1129]KAA9402160.1 hypothetical protein Har1130_05175 [Haloarcula sp. CBA1130]
MSATGREPTPATSPGDLAGSLREAAFVRLVSDATGEALAATGLLARALDDTPFQASVVRPFEDPDRTTETDITIAIGCTQPTADVTLTDRAAATAFETARELGTADRALALAGTIAAGDVDGTVAEAAEQAGLERRPGVAVPTADLVDGLAHSTLFVAPFSGDADTVRAELAELGLGSDPVQAGNLSTDDHRRLASLVALAVTADAPPRAADAVQRALRPTVGGPFETVGGYADVLDAVAREQPGTAVALALGHEAVREDALAAWRSHATRAHKAVSEATTGRYDGLFVARGDAMPTGTVARLFADYRAPEPVTLVVTDDQAAARATDGRDVAETMDAAASAVGGDAVGTGDRARARFDVSTADFIEAFREAV